RGSCRLRETVHIAEADRLVRLERALEAELLRHLAYRREHFLPQQADAALGILVRHGAVITPEAENAGPRLFHEDTQLGDHRLRRAGDDHQFFELFLERRAVARVFRPTGGELDKGASVFRAAVARGCAPNRMGETGELTLHPGELARVLDRLLL